MLPMVARVSRGSAATPAPKHSTNDPTTPWSRSSSVTVSTTSVAVIPGWGSPEMRRPTTGGSSIGEGLAQHGRLRLYAAHAPAEHAPGR